MAARAWTIGHSNRPLDAFVDALAAHGIEAVADVRRFPGSRSQPHFAGEAIARSLAARGIDYAWIPALGGRRRARPDSPNDGWTHPAFRAYADHVASEEFAAGVFELAMLAGGLATAIMCAEAQWWRCHRRLIADVLVFAGFEVEHILDARRADAHRLERPARVVAGRLTYASAAAAVASPA
jgi:uncharacterized protein (DUF488 family)